MNLGTSGGFDIFGCFKRFLSFVRALVLQSSDRLFRCRVTVNISIIWHFTVIQAKLLIYSMIVGHGVCKWWSSGVKIQVNISEEIITFNKLSLHYCSGIIWRLLSHPWSLPLSLFFTKNSEKLFLLSPVLRRRPAYQQIYRMFHVFFVRVTIRPELNCLEQDDEVLVREIEK